MKYQSKLCLYAIFLVFVSSLDCTFHDKNTTGTIYLNYFHRSMTSPFEIIPYSLTDKTFYVNICSEVSWKKFCDGASGQDTGAFGYSKSTSYVPPSCEGMGDPKETSLSYNPDTQTTTVFYNNKPGEMKTKINIICDTTIITKPKTTALKFKEYDSNHTVHLELRHKCGCPNEYSCRVLFYPLGPVYGFGGIFLTVVVLAVAGYFLIGSVIRLVMGKRSYDVIPHLKFIMDIPFLLKDGVLYPFDLVILVVNKIKRDREPYGHINVETSTYGEM